MVSFRSHRVPADLAASPLAEAREQMDEIPYDLTVSNPLSCGISYSSDLLRNLGHQRALDYEPDPRGPVAAREAVASQYRQWKVEVDPGRVFLTASTSEAYGFLFRLLADPGETVLVPAPSYPLFDQLARLDGIEVRGYSLEADIGWRLDFSTLEEAPDTVRAVVVVHPNNPTGSFIHPEDARRLVDLCRDRGWALIADEVFLPYVLDGGPGEGCSFAGTDGCLCFALGGLSKSIGLPQLKLAWIVANGPADDVERALEGLEYVADAYLSVSTPVALAAPQLLTEGAQIRDAINDRCRANLETLRAAAENFPFATLPEVGGGWSAVVQVPVVMDDDELCLRLLEERGVAVHPGYLFQFPSQGYLVLSLLPAETVFTDAVTRLFDGLNTIVNDHTASSDHDDIMAHESPRSPRLSSRVRSKSRQWMSRAASVVGLLSLLSGVVIAQYGSPWKILHHGIDQRLRFLVTDPTEVLVAFAVMIFGAVVLAGLSSKQLPGLKIADQLPWITFKASRKGMGLIAAAVLTLTVLCIFLSGDRGNLWDPFLLAATLVLSAIGVNSIDATPKNDGPQRILTRTDVLFISMTAIVVVWAASRGLTDWYFSWIGDEGAFFNAARFLAEGGPLSLFDLTYVYKTHTVVDSIYQSVFLRILGHNVFAWRFAEVVVAAFAAVLAYVVFVHLVRGPDTHRTTLIRLPALISALVLGSSAFTMAFCHIGYNNLHAMVPPLLVMLILARLPTNHRAVHLLLLGWAFGLCLYTFLAAILTWIVVAIFFFRGLFRRPFKTQAAAVILVVAGFSTVVLPALLTNPDPLLGSFEQSNSVGLGGSESQLENGAKGLARTVIAFWHNEEWFHHYIAGPLLGPVGGALAFLGLIAAWLARRRSPGDRFLLIWFFTGIVVIAFTNYTEIPSFTRLLFVMPALALLAGRGAMVIADILRNRLGFSTVPVAVMFSVLIAVIPSANLYQLLTRTPERLPAHQQSFTIRALQENPGRPLVEIAQEIEHNRDLMISFYPWYAERHSWALVPDEDADIPRIAPESIVLVYDESTLKQASALLGGRWRPRSYPDSRYRGAIWIFMPKGDENQDEIGP